MIANRLFTVLPSTNTRRLISKDLNALRYWKHEIVLRRRKGGYMSSVSYFSMHSLYWKLRNEGQPAIIAFAMSFVVKN